MRLPPIASSVDLANLLVQEDCHYRDPCRCEDGRSRGTVRRRHTRPDRQKVMGQYAGPKRDDRDHSPAEEKQAANPPNAAVAPPEGVEAVSIYAVVSTKLN